jgi:hypothetical protein
MIDSSMENQTKSSLKATIEWLLDSSNPSVRYRTLIDLKELPEDHPSVLKTHRAIQKSEPIQKLLNHQMSDGCWRGAKGDVWEERGTVFSLLILAEIGMDKSAATERAFDFLHERFQLPSGRITYRSFKKITQKELTSTWMWCITAAVLRSGALLGHLEHPAIQNAIGFFEENYREEGGWYCSTYSGDSSKVHPANCYMGTIKALGAFSAIPSGKRSKRLRTIIDEQVNTCLENEVCFYRINPKGQPSIKRAWLKFAFPRYWRSDTLEAVDILTTLGTRDSRMEKAIAIIKEKMQPDIRWLMDFSETKRAWVQIESEGMPSKWITLRALRILKRLEQ